MDGIPSKELANMIAHGDHLTIVAHGTPAERRMILDAADEPLVRAISSAARSADEGGVLPEEIYEKHSRKLATAVSKR